MSGYRVLKTVIVRDGHAPTGRTRHSVNGIECPAPAQLQIVQIGADPGYYLLYLDRSGREMTDTWHDTLERAIAQAEFEFNVKPADWREPT